MNVLVSTYDCNTPEYLFDGGRKSLTRIMGLCSCQANKFCPRKRECGRDEEVTKAFEPIVESSWFHPVSTTNVASIGISTAIDNNSKKAVTELVSDLNCRERDILHEANDCSDLEDREEVFGLSISLNAT